MFKYFRERFVSNACNLRSYLKIIMLHSSADLHPDLWRSGKQTGCQMLATSDPDGEDGEGPWNFRHRLTLLWPREEFFAFQTGLCTHIQNLLLSLQHKHHITEQGCVAITIYTCMWEALGSSIGPDGLHGFNQSLPTIAGAAPRIKPRPLPSTSLFTNYPSLYSLRYSCRHNINQHKVLRRTNSVLFFDTTRIA
jgi:hypothetical protein